MNKLALQSGSIGSLWRSVGVWAIAFVWLGQLAQAQDLVGQAITGIEQNDAFGHSIALSADGSRMAIGAMGNTNNGQESGFVRVYELQNASWVQIGTDIIGEAAFDFFGHSLDISADGNRIIVGAYLSDDQASNAGKALVFEYDGTDWAQLGNAVFGQNPDDQFGRSVAMASDGQRIVVGARNVDATTADDVGAVYSYQYNGSSWTQIGQTLVGDQEADWFGHAVDMSPDGQRIAIGAPLRPGPGSSTGFVQVYHFDSVSWVRVASTIRVAALTGWAVSLANNEVVAIGAPGGNGMVRVFQRSGNQWSQIGSDINGDEPGDNLGRTVALSDAGQELVVGAPFHQANGFRSGQVRSFRRSGNNWSQFSDDILGEATTEQTGFSVAISGEGAWVGIGAPGHDQPATNAGRAQVFDPLPPKLIHVFPEDETADLPITHNELRMKFSEDIRAGAGNLRLIDAIGDTLTIDIQGPKVVFRADSVVIMLDSTLNDDTRYTLLLDSGAVTDRARIAYDGILVPNVWNFDTEDLTPPTLVSVTPANGSTNQLVSLASLRATFSENVMLGMGRITLFGQGDVRTFNVQDASVSTSGNGLSISLADSLLFDTLYYVEIEPGAITDLAGNPFEGILGDTLWQFRTEVKPEPIPPVLVSTSPANGAQNIPTSLDVLVANFNKTMTKGIGRVFLINASTNLPREIDVSSALVTVSGSSLTVSLNEPLESGTEYFVLMSKGILFGEEGLEFEGVASDRVWRFKTEGVASVEEADVVEANIYPNPTKDLLHIELSHSPEAQMLLWNASGQLVRSAQLPQKAVINLQHLPSGLYTLQLLTAQGRMTKRIIKE